MRRGVVSANVFGVRVGVDSSWILLAALIAWSLAVGVFPDLYKGLPASSYWGMAAVTVAGLGVSIVLHELAHTFVGRALGIPVGSVTLFVFGGVSELTEEPHAPRSELLMAIAGPLMSALLGAGFLGLSRALPAGTPAETAGVLHYLGVVNLTLAVFNMLPAFPLDGGRVLRALLWMWRGDLHKATRTAARWGESIGVGMMIVGALAALTGQVVGGLWWVVLGLFLRSMAKSYAQDVETRHALGGVAVRELMTPDPVTAPADMSVADFVETRLRRLHHEIFPVVDGDRLVGAAGFREAKAVDQAAWPTTRLGDVCTPASQVAAVDAGMDAADAVRRMQQADRGRLLVMDGDRLVGVLALKDLLGQLRFRSEFGG